MVYGEQKLENSYKHSDKIEKINIPVINQKKNSRILREYKIQDANITVNTEMIEKDLRTIKSGKSTDPERIQAELIKYGPKNLKKC